MMERFYITRQMHSDSKEAPHGRRHDVWTDGDRHEPIPRHIEINEKLARSILRKAKKGGNL